VSRVYKARNLTEQKKLTKIQGVQQLKKEIFMTDSATQLDVFQVKYPKGSVGNIKKYLHLGKENFKKKKTAIVQIHKPKDSMCLPRAHVVARVRTQKPEVPNLVWENE
jgi:hypothetical protein